MEKNDQDLAVIKQIDNSLQNIENEIFYSERNPYYLVFNHISFPIIIFTRGNWTIVECNDAAVNFFKYSKKELMMTNFFDLFPREGADKIRSQFINYDLAC